MKINKNIDMNIKGKKTSMSSGITLIALVITIIVLLILAGIALASLSGENGLLNRSSQAKEEAVKAQLKEEIEMAIMDIQAEEIPKGNNVTLESLAGQGEEDGQLEKSENLMEGEITSQLDQEENKITGEYKNYEYEIDDKFNVTIVDKMAGEKPEMTYELTPNAGEAKEVVITVTAKVSDGIITKIIKPNGEEELNTEGTNTQEITYKVTNSGKYTFRAQSSTGRIGTCIVKVTNIIPTSPIIEVTQEGGYPLLTLNGFKESESSISIKLNDNQNDSKNIKIYYNEDNEENWKEYTGEFSTSATTIKAKSAIVIDKDTTLESTVISKTLSKPTDCLGKNAYDRNKGTWSCNAKHKFQVDESTYGCKLKIVYMITRASATSAHELKCRQVNSNGSEISSLNFAWSPNSEVEVESDYIKEGTAAIELYDRYNGSHKFYIFEISLIKPDI